MKKTVVGSGLFPLLLIASAMGDEPQVALKPLSIGALQEFGILGSGHFGKNPGGFHDEWVDHFGAFVTQTGDVSDKLTFDVGLGGIFQYEKPENISPTWGGTQYKDFFMGPTVADLKYKVGPADNPYATVQFGLFSYKYSSSNNLGEYLFRSGPYPTFLWTGGYALINNTSAGMQGLRVNVSRIPNLDLDLFLTSETFVPPLYDFSLGAVAKYEIGHGLLTLGGGLQLKRLFSFTFRSDVKVGGDDSHFLINFHGPKTIELPSNSYFTEGGITYTGNVDYYLDQKTFFDKAGAAATASGDAASAAADKVQSDHLDSTINFLKTRLADSSAGKPSLNYYTTAGTMVMGMFSIDPKKAFQSDIFGPEDLKLYGEISVLGWKNYPIFYKKRTDRMPVMLGFNLPGFKFLDLISLEWEYFNSPWINSYSELGLSNGATPDLPNGQDDWSSKSAYNDVAGKDNVSWSLLVKKTVAHSITISGQVARDHVRMPSFQSWFGPGLDPNEALSTSKDWYWMLQFAFGI